jgi:leucyl aminopeptidase
MNDIDNNGSIIPTPNPAIAAFISEIRADSLQSYVQWMQNMGTRFALADNRREVAMNIRNRFIEFGYPDTKLDSFFITKVFRGATYNTWQYNVVATLEGEFHPDSICIIGGHYDCITSSSLPFNYLFSAPGANDNASGVAAALEVARVMHTKNFKPNITIKFIAFAAEEIGLLGSYDYAIKASNTGAKVKMMLNNDMIAYHPGSDPASWVVNILDYPNSTTLRKKAQQYFALYTPIRTNNDNTYQDYSDSAPFALYGFKAIFFITNADDPNYHTLNDLTSACNFNFCREVVKVNCALLIAGNGV